MVGQKPVVDLQERRGADWLSNLATARNGTIIGASANVVVAQVARRNFYPFSFFHFMKYGFPIMIASAILSSIYVVLRYFT